jgi:hypothetical protein
MHAGDILSYALSGKRGESLWLLHILQLRRNLSVSAIVP